MKRSRILSLLLVSLLGCSVAFAQTKKPQPKPKAPTNSAAKPKAPAKKPAAKKPVVKKSKVPVPPGFKVTPNGLPYKLIRGTDTSRRVNYGDVVVMHYIVMKNKDSIFVSSYVPRNKPIQVSINHPTYKGCVYEGLSLMNVSDSAVFIVNVDSLFINTFRQPASVIPPFVPRGSIVSVCVRMFNAKSQIEMWEEKNREAEKKRKDEFFDIEAYLASHKLNAMKTASGVRYVKTVTNMAGTQVESGDEVHVHYTGKFLNDTVFESSVGGEPFSFKVDRNQSIKGWDEAIQLMKEGEKAILVIPFDLAYGVEGMSPGMPPYATLVFEIEVMKVKKGVKALPYITQGKDTITTASGLKYIVVENGTGPAAGKGKTVKVHYTGYLLDGTKFDSSVERESPFDVNIGAKDVIEGWDEMLALMSKGQKVRVIIPHQLAYGEGGRPPVIPPAATLIFDIEVLDVQ